MVAKPTRIIMINHNGKQSFNFNSKGEYWILFKNFKGEISCRLSRPGVKVYLWGLYQLSNHDNFSITTYQIHQARETFSNLLVKGVFDSESKFTFRGLIKIEKQAQKSYAYQKNQNLVLSPMVFIDSKPELEIEANDVFCTHGSTTGYLDQEQIFYLLARGISQKLAKKLLIEGFLSEVKKVFEHATKIKQSL